mmetsp:Transcript_12642/g.26637  ORF Transcript_12642/g.26637 Transcript_12642/m.26637 type:complete len:244 (+) Transcript_12642:931-1662(+)
MIQCWTTSRAPRRKRTGRATTPADWIRGWRPWKDWASIPAAESASDRWRRLPTATSKGGGVERIAAATPPTAATTTTNTFPSGREKPMRASTNTPRNPCGSCWPVDTPCRKYEPSKQEAATASRPRFCFRGCGRAGEPATTTTMASAKRETARNAHLRSGPGFVDRATRKRRSWRPSTEATTWHGLRGEGTVATTPTATTTTRVWTAPATTPSIASSPFRDTNHPNATSARRPFSWNSTWTTA